jgi:hypothetical protein
MVVQTTVGKPVLGRFGSGTVTVATQNGTYFSVRVCLEGLDVTARYPSRTENTYTELFHGRLALVVKVPIPLLTRVEQPDRDYINDYASCALLTKEYGGC